SNERLNAPADLEEMARYTQLLIGQGARKLNLPQEALDRLSLPFPSPEELERHFAIVIARSETRTSHKLLGFDRVTEFTIEAGEAPRSFTELALLSPKEQSQVKLIERMESPIERWTRLSQANSRLPVKAAALALLLLTPKPVVYRNNCVTFTHEGAGYTFVDPEGHYLTKLPDRAELLGYFNPSAPGELYLSTLEGQYAGTLTLLGGRKGGVNILDTEALDLAREQRAKIVNRDIAAVRARHGDADAELGGMRAHNDALVEAHRSATLPPAPASIPSADPRTLLPSLDGTPAPAAVSFAEDVATRRARIAEARTTQRALQRARNESETLLDAPAGASQAPTSLSAEDLL
ncbi:MAG TPA: hypothetical protein VII43_02230, partial [Opitutaceae bacterium]